MPAYWYLGQKLKSRKEFMTTREDLKKTLLNMTPAEIQALTDEAAADAAREKSRRDAARSDDPIGTIRYDHIDGGSDILFVREAGRQWNPWIEDNHGISMSDDQMEDWRTLPIVGTMPEEWIAEARRYEDDYDDDE